MRRALNMLPAAALVGLLAGCSSPTHAPLDYVAIGDSYSASPRTGEVDPPAICGRSTNNYPHLVAEQSNLRLRDVTCSSASTNHVTSEQPIFDQSVPPQLDAVDKDTDIVTISLGFNDYGISSGTFVVCPQLAAVATTGTPCSDADAAAGITGGGVTAAVPKVADRLTEVIDAVQSRARRATVIVIGYPTVYPDKDTCADLGIPSGDLPLLTSVIDGLNQSAQKAAESTGATYLDIATPSRGHDICSSTPWIAGKAPAPGRPGFAWHPYAEEQAMVAEHLGQLIKELRR